MTGTADAVSDSVFVLDACLRERSGGSTVAALRDVWQMARRRRFTGNHEDARRLLATEPCRLVDCLGKPIMVRPAAS